jgi:hypothetical protein
MCLAKIPAWASTKQGQFHLVAAWFQVIDLQKQSCHQVDNFISIFFGLYRQLNGKGNEKTNINMHWTK